MQSEIRFANCLYEFTNQLAEENSNAVLEILDNDRSIVEKVKYPKDQLRFGESRWRSYYHCHDSPIRAASEHGHFHLFYQLQPDDEQCWAHIAGVALDKMGQPLNWFLSNRWVTDGPWLTLECLQDCLNTLDAFDAELFSAFKTVEGWLLSLLGLYHGEIVQLYYERDEHIKKIAAGKTLEEIQEDRQIYGLARHDIDLFQKLSKILPKDTK